MNNKYKVFISSFLTSLGLFCYFKPNIGGNNKEYKIPKIHDPWLSLQYGGIEDN